MQTLLVMIQSLTPKQESVIPVYRQKWQQLAFTTEPLDLDLATEAIYAAYATIARQQPEIRFFPSPYAALRSIAPQDDAYAQINHEVGKLLEQKISQYLWNQLKTQLQQELSLSLHRQICFPYQSRLWTHLWDQLETCEDLGELRELRQWMDTEPLGDLNGMEWSLDGSLFDFCFSILGCNDGQDKLDVLQLSFSGKRRAYPSRWQVYQMIAEHCSWFFPVDGLCLVSDRPRFLNLDQNHRFHAEDQPAVVFSDGFSLFVTHGQTYFPGTS